MTCWHVWDSNIKPTAFRYDNFTKKNTLTQTTEKHESIDLVVLSVDGLKLQKDDFLKIGKTDSVKIGEAVKCYGFGGYSNGCLPVIVESQIDSMKSISSVKYFVVGGNIRGGQSGAPVLNKNNEVIGVLVKSINAGNEENLVISIDALKFLKKIN